MTFVIRCLLLSSWIKLISELKYYTKYYKQTLFWSLVSLHPRSISNYYNEDMIDHRSFGLSYIHSQLLLLIIKHVPFIQVKWQNQKSPCLRSRHHSTVLLLLQINDQVHASIKYKVHSLLLSERNCFGFGLPVYFAPFPSSWGRRVAFNFIVFWMTFPILYCFLRWTLAESLALSVFISRWNFCLFPLARPALIFQMSLNTAITSARNWESLQPIRRLEMLYLKPRIKS